jgi:hypothetical protein
MLLNRLDLVIFNAQHTLWKHFFVDHVLGNINRQRRLCVFLLWCLSRLLAFRHFFHRFRLILRLQWHCYLLTDEDLFSKEGQPVLEVRHDSVLCLPLLLTIAIVTQVKLRRINFLCLLVCRVTAVRAIEEGY